MFVETKELLFECYFQPLNVQIKDSLKPSLVFYQRKNKNVSKRKRKQGISQQEEILDLLKNSTLRFTATVIFVALLKVKSEELSCKNCAALKSLSIFLFEYRITSLRVKIDCASITSGGVP